MSKQIVKIEIATQNANGVTREGLTVHGPGREWQNLVVDELQQAGVPSGDLVHLCIINTDGSCNYQFFTW